MGARWLGDDIEFLIFAGKDERAMQRMDLVGAETAVKIDPRLAD
jgi:hypothetical protein